MESAIKASNVEPPGRHIVLTLLTATTAATAEVPPAHAPTFTDLERETGLSRSALTEWMKALTDGGWVSRVSFPEESRLGFRLAVGDPNAARAPRSHRSKRANTADGAYRQAVQAGSEDVPPGGMDRTAERYADVPPGGTPDEAHLLKDSPTESLDPPNLDPAQPSDEPRPDVERICEYLANWIVQNGSRKPTITKQWRDEARRLIDRDKRTVEEIRDVIRWCQRDHFWRRNVLSMPTFRKQYDRLRLAWQDDPDNTGAGRPNGHQPYSNDITDDEYREYASRGR
ncbi:hypothetical protein C1I95_32305 [Micromonospora craterilacus]|uniref:Uncharacterized protein n=1 Tax=Micromonospora craterilacus TaxID=1655439 RepID=A0A2W2EMV9_9ACTN|nr:hypothetical protein [Micromonospora craterilacus]PZG06084.1 hypothetical protein C1I95_32305 [Micromonospora craterilacus]